MRFANMDTLCLPLVVISLYRNTFDRLPYLQNKDKKWVNKKWGLVPRTSRHVVLAVYASFHLFVHNGFVAVDPMGSIESAMPCLWPWPWRMDRELFFCVALIYSHFPQSSRTRKSEENAQRSRCFYARFYGVADATLGKSTVEDEWRHFPLATGWRRGLRNGENGKTFAVEPPCCFYLQFLLCSTRLCAPVWLCVCVYVEMKPTSMYWWVCFCVEWPWPLESGEAAIESPRCYSYWCALEFIQIFAHNSNALYAFLASGD